MRIMNYCIQSVIKKRKAFLRLSLIFIFYLTASLSLYAQFEAQLSQYMFNPASFNAASIGEDGMINIVGQHRIQWVGMPGAPQTTYFNVNAPFEHSDKLSHGVGIKFLNDRIGAFSNQSAHFQYAYKRKIGKGVASIGADIGFVSVGFIADSIKNVDINSEFHDFLGDTAIPTVDDVGMNADFSAAVFYSIPAKLHLGISYLHLNTPKILLNDDKTEFNIRNVLYAVGGYDQVLGDPKWLLRSNSLIKTDFLSFQADISSRIEYDKKLWGGLSYRILDSAIVFVGTQLMNGLSLGYAYDLPTSKMIRASSGSHEVFISYNFLFDTNNNKNRYKSIRIL